MGKTVREINSGFTLIEVIMVIALLSVIGTLVLPVIDKPFQVLQLSLDRQDANERAITLLHFLNSDLKQSVDAIELGENGSSINIYKESKTIHYTVRSNEDQPGRRYLYREIYTNKQSKSGDNLNSTTKNLVESAIVVDYLTDVFFEWGKPYLSIRFDIESSRSGSISYWRQLAVHESL